LFIIFLANFLASSAGVMHGLDFMDYKSYFYFLSMAQLTICWLNKFNGCFSIVCD